MVGFFCFVHYGFEFIQSGFDFGSGIGYGFI